MHKEILRTLQDGGAQFSRDPWHLETSQRDHRCHCGKSFTTPQGLAAHRRLIHSEHAPEYPYVDGADCPMRHFWTSQRLAQHLAPCFAQLQQYYPEAQHATCKAPRSLQAAVRMDALPLAGPLPVLDSTLRACCRQHLQQELQEILCQQDYTSVPEDDPDGHMLRYQLRSATLRWFDMYQTAGFQTVGIPEIADMWMATMLEVEPAHHDWAGFVFMTWGQQGLPDVIAGFVDGEAEGLVDDAFAVLVQDMPCYDVFRRADELCGRLHRLQGDPEPQAHRPVYRGPASDRERLQVALKVPSLLQTDWQSGLLDNSWDMPHYAQHLPLIELPDGKRGVIVNRLFSGRRREHDFHFYLHRHLHEKQIVPVILSLDTAVSPSYGDLKRTSSTWNMLTKSKCYQAGWVGATMSGAPCETWSEARFQERARKGPRPLRSAQQPYGLFGLTGRELDQAQQGSEFFLQTMAALGCHVTQGGFFLAEHPATPRDAARPSTWRTPIARLFRLHPEAGLETVGQWLWGAPTVKPTSLFQLRLPHLRRTMWRTAGFSRHKPADVAIGQTADKQFRTASLKEYPRDFSKGLALVIGEAMVEAVASGRARTVCPRDFPELWEWVCLANTESSQIRQGAKWLPDYQG
eukprot:Skav214931  [mRNA]  locus=scaffold3017:41362:43257:- [translate_table: standard]